MKPKDANSSFNAYRDNELKDLDEENNTDAEYEFKKQNYEFEVSIYFDKSKGAVTYKLLFGSR
jgi:hypothetical protein